MNWGSKLTEVDKNFVWREHVKKEKRCFKFDNEFQANPYRCTKLSTCIYIYFKLFDIQKHTKCVFFIFFLTTNNTNKNKQ